ncbi:exp1-like protein [Tulasnella sp. 403]|nr:exp1-like protein [Tulasnella sp. 403]
MLTPPQPTVEIDPELARSPPPRPPLPLDPSPSGLSHSVSDEFRRFTDYKSYEQSLSANRSIEGGLGLSIEPLPPLLQVPQPTTPLSSVSVLEHRDKVAPGSLMPNWTGRVKDGESKGTTAKPVNEGSSPIQSPLLPLIPPQKIHYIPAQSSYLESSPVDRTRTPPSFVIEGFTSPNAPIPPSVFNFPLSPQRSLVFPSPAGRAVPFIQSSTQSPSHSPQFSPTSTTGSPMLLDSHDTTVESTSVDPSPNWSPTHSASAFAHEVMFPSSGSQLLLSQAETRSPPRRRRPKMASPERLYTTSAAPGTEGETTFLMEEPTAGKQGRKRKSEDSPQDESKTKDKPKSATAPTKSVLQPPKPAPSKWQIFFSDFLNETKANSLEGKINVALVAKNAAAAYKTVSGPELEALNKRARQAKERYNREFAEWQRTLTPDDIRNENAFRTAQRRLGQSRKANMKDPNAPKKPMSPYFIFLQNIRSSPEMSKEIFGEETDTPSQSRLAAAKWRGMTDEEKKPFLAQAEQEKHEYKAKFKEYEKQFASHRADGPQVDEFTDQIAEAVLGAEGSHDP